MQGFGSALSNGRNERMPRCVDDHHLARLDVAEEGRADHVESDGFGREDRRLAELAHDQWANAQRVAAGEQAVLGQDEQRVGAFDLAQRVGQPLDRGRIFGCRDEVDDDLGVAGRLEDRAAPVEGPAQLHRVRQIAVLGDREAALGELGEQRLDIAQRRFAGRRIAHVADRRAPGSCAHHLVAVEIAGDVAHRPVRVEMGAVEAGDAGRFLAAVLQRVQPERDEARGIVGTPNAENAAFLAQLVVIERIGRQHVPASGLKLGLI